MRRTIGFMFLFLTGLNTIGYYGMLLMAKRELAKEIIHKIDENVNELSGNMILKIPLSLPYSIGPEEYERANGEIVYDGTVYRFIKQRLFQDTLYIVCIRDQRGTDVENLMTEYTKSFSNEAQEQSTGLKLFGSLAKYYLLYNQSAMSERDGWDQPKSFTAFIDLYQLNSPGSIFHPPQHQQA